MATFSVTQEEAERIVKDAMRHFGITKAVRVHLVTNAELQEKFGEKDDTQALCIFDPDHSDCDVYLSDIARDPVLAIYHEIAHLAFVDLHLAIQRLSEVEEKLVDYFAYLAKRSRRKGGKPRHDRSRTALPTGNPDRAGEDPRGVS